MKLSPSAQKAFDRFMNSDSAEVMGSFSEEQLDAVKNFLNTQYWKRHPVDIRLSLPLIFTRFYFVLIAGTEKRSVQRRQQDRNETHLWTPANIIVFLLTTCAGVAVFWAGLSLSQVRFAPLNLNQEPFPTTYPLKGDRESCEESGRVWKKGECYDYDHNPNF